MATEGKLERFYALDGLRGLAAMLVVLHHFYVTGSLADIRFTHNLYMMVDLFFVLSGFVIAHSCKGIDSLQDIKVFMIKRFARIYPLHILTLSALIPMAVFSSYYLPGNGESERFALSSFFANVFLVDSFGLFSNPTWNMPSWSIAVEFWTYLMFSVFIFFSFFKNYLAFLLLAVVSFLTLFLLSDEFLKDTSTWSFLRCLTGFFLGSTVYYIRKKMLHYRPLISYQYASSFEVVVLFLVLFVLTYGDYGVMFVVPFLFSLMVYIYSFDAGSISKLLKSKFFQSTGLWSYSIYLIHPVIFLAFKGASIMSERFLSVSWYDSKINHFDFGSDLSNNVSYFAALALVILLSRYTYLLVEAPLQKKIRKEFL